MSPKYLFQLVLISFTLWSCSEDEKPIPFEEQHITTEHNSLVEIHIPKAIGNSNAISKINKTLLEKTAMALQLDQDKQTVNSLEDNISIFNKEYRAFKDEFSDSVIEWEAQIDGEVMFQSPELISISLTTYTNTGGAHGILVINFLNFDAKSGLLIENKGLFTDKTSFTKLAQPYFEAEIQDKKEMYFEADTFSLPQNIGYSSDGLIFLYNTYEIAPYATGITEFVIPFKDANPYLKFNGI